MKIPIQFGGLQNSVDATKISPSNCYSMSNCGVDAGILQLGPRDSVLGSRPGANAGDICWGFGYGKYTTNDVRQLSIAGGVPTSGYFTLTFGGGTSGQINYNSPAFDTTSSQSQSSSDDITTALLSIPALTNYQAGVSGGPLPLSPVLISFGGPLSGQSQGVVGVGTSTLNNSATVSVNQFINAGLQELYLVMIQHQGNTTCTLWSVTSNDHFQTNTTWTQVANGLTKGTWNFVQYQDKIYATTKNGPGIYYYQLGGVSPWSGPPSISGFGRPGQITTLPINQYANSHLKPTITLSSVVASGFSNAPSIPNQSNFTSSQTIVTTGVENSRNVSVTYNFLSNQDISLNDSIVMLLVGPPTGVIITGLSVKFVTSGSVSVYPDATTPLQLFNSNNPNIGASNLYYFGLSSKQYRTSVSSMVISFTLTAINNAVINFYVEFGDVLMNDKMEFLNLGEPTFKTISYAVSYYKSSTNQESQLSPIVQTPTLPRSNPKDAGSSLYDNPQIGCRVVIGAPGSSYLTTSDFVKFYRQDQSGIWRFLGQLPNITSGIVDWTDALMEDEVENLPVYGLNTLPGGFVPDNLSTWKGSLLASSDRKIFFSYVGQPNHFAGDPAQVGVFQTYSPSDPNQPRTVYMDNSRSDGVYAMVAQDTVFLGGLAGTYAMVNGTTPYNLNPPLLMPGSRGTLGYFSSYTFRGGALMASLDGIYYYSASNYFTGSDNPGGLDEEEMTREVRGSWNQIGGSSPVGLILKKWKDEIWAVNGNQYLRRTRNQHWEQGTLNYSYFNIIPNTVNGLLGATSTGLIAAIGGNDGTSSWSYTTGIFDVERIKINQLAAYYVGSPRVTITAWDGVNQTYSQPIDLVNGKTAQFATSPTNLIQGSRIQIVVFGKATDQLSSLVLDGVGIGGGKNN